MLLKFKLFPIFIQYLLHPDTAPVYIYRFFSTNVQCIETAVEAGEGIDVIQICMSLSCQGQSTDLPTSKDLQINLFPLIGLLRYIRGNTESPVLQDDIMAYSFREKKCPGLVLRTELRLFLSPRFSPFRP